MPLSRQLIQSGLAPEQASAHAAGMGIKLRLAGVESAMASARQAAAAVESSEAFMFKILRS